MLTSDEEYELVAIYFFKKRWRFQSALKWMKKNNQLLGLFTETSDGWMFPVKHSMISDKCICAKLGFGIEGIYDIQNYVEDDINNAKQTS